MSSTTSRLRRPSISSSIVRCRWLSLRARRLSSSLPWIVLIGGAANGVVGGAAMPEIVEPFAGDLAAAAGACYDTDRLTFT